jgi:uncharacterized protein (TIGR01777 family)
MRVAVTGATGLIGARLVSALRARGDQITVLSRQPAGATAPDGVEVLTWDPISGPAPGLSGHDGVMHLAGEPVAQRWTAAAMQRIRASRAVGTANLVAGLAAADPRPRVLVSTSASGYYGDRGDAVLDESAAPGPAEDFLASVCLDWERAADAAGTLGIRVAVMRNGVVLDRAGGALGRMLPPFRAGAGGPVGGGRQFMPWIALDDVVGLYMAALQFDSWSGPVNACAPTPVTNREFTRALGRALHRPAVVPLPAAGLRLLFGDMASILLASQRMAPARALELGYEFRFADLDRALAAALGSAPDV